MKKQWRCTLILKIPKCRSPSCCQYFHSYAGIFCTYYYYIQSFLEIIRFCVSFTFRSIVFLYYSLLVLQTSFLSVNAINVWNMTDIKKYPACLDDTECEKLDSRKQNAKNHHACFQYFCYPWKETATTAAKSKDLAFKGCRRNKDCKSKDNKKNKCFR